MKPYFLLTAGVISGALLWTSVTAAFPSLGTIVESAKTKGPQAIMAEADVRVSSASLALVGLPPMTNPYFEVFATRGRSTDAVAIESNLYLPVELNGQGHNRAEEARALVAWKKLARLSACARGIGDAVTAYGELAVAVARARVASDGKRVAEDEAAYVSIRFAAKDATTLDNSLAAGEVARWSQSVDEAQVSLSLAHARLAAAISEPKLESPPADLDPNLPMLRWSSEDEFVTHLLQDSPWLAVADLELAFHRASKTRLESDRYQPLQLILSAGRGDLGDFRYGGGLAWTFPVVQRNQVEIARAQAEGERVGAARTVAQTTIEAKGRGLFRAYMTVAKALSAIDNTSIPAANAVVDATVSAWKAGKIDLSRVFLARRDLAAVRTKRLDVVAQGWQVYGELTGVLGSTP